MSSLRLTVWRQDGLEVAVVDRAEDGTTSIVRCTDRVRADLDRWLRRGLSELVGTPGDRRPRKTPPASADLLPRIAERLIGYGFVTRVERWEVSPAIASFIYDIELPRAVDPRGIPTEPASPRPVAISGRARMPEVRLGGPC